jgi:hypothetical protein
VNKQAAALLLGYLTAQLEDIHSLYTKLRATNPGNEERTIYIGYLLHNLYCALEDLFLEIAKTFENHIEDPSRFHQALLKQMTIEVPKIRPSVLSRKSHRVLDELGGFRHLFRHAYGYTLDSNKVVTLKSSIEQHWNEIMTDLNIFKAFLHTLL